jgi:starch phosphorylase
MRSAYKLKQNLIGIGILWKYGYYDQVRAENNEMAVLFQEKNYNFLQDTGIVFTVDVHNHPVKVKAFYLAPEVFGTVPMFFLSTDVPENDYLSQTITHKLYDSDLAARIASSIILGVGGAKLLDIINYTPEIYHMNEAHALPLTFYLYNKHKDKEEVKKRVVFTTHTPEEAGNEKNEINLLEKMGYFQGIPVSKIRSLTNVEGPILDHSLVAMRFSHKSNGVSKLHGKVSRGMWSAYKGVPEITSITNAQDYDYWADKALYQTVDEKDQKAFFERKRKMKTRMINYIADQTGKVFDPDTLTVVWARRFAAYKRADLITHDYERFVSILENADKPVQIVWAGKPYPEDHGAVGLFNHLIHMTKGLKNATVLTGYELYLSHILKMGADVWLNNPRVPREASGTSGMTAAMNGSINLSTQDGWIPEFMNPGKNVFVTPLVDQSLPHGDQDLKDRDALLDALQNEIVPMYYDNPKAWFKMVSQSMNDVVPQFGSERMAKEYYEVMFK